MSTTLPPIPSEGPSGNSATPPEVEWSAKTQPGCPKPDQISILEDQENLRPALKKFCGTRCTITARWGQEKFEYTKNMYENSENRRIKVSFNPNPQTGRITFVFDIHCFEGYPEPTTQIHGDGHSLQYGDLNKPFYGNLPDGTPAFGDMRAESSEDHPSPNLPTIPNSPAVGDQLAVGQPCQKSIDGGKANIQYGKSTKLGELKRSSCAEDVSGSGVKRQRLSLATVTGGDHLQSL
ncbi:hypothetical protein QBC37DRAFT_434749 [Rhypophila decipiens]|uniref:Uncharacterized protein n=1 Tax=Rhypophila decipiens TaxID=261697 RepID=A0AAN6XU03_9PEZI|nr:hypothetical protein QBC37DRAFT_434749 [Rhypophila decipiens]